MRLRVVLALLQWSKNRLQHVAHHLEARVDDEVDKTCTGVFYRTNVPNVSKNISIARQRARHAQRDIATANRSSVCLSVCHGSTMKSIKPVHKYYRTLVYTISGKNAHSPCNYLHHTVTVSCVQAM